MGTVAVVVAKVVIEVLGEGGRFGNQGLGETRFLARRQPPPGEGHEGPEGDVSQLAEFVLAHRELAEYLRERRAVVMEQWFKHPTHGARARAVAATWA